MEIAKSLPWLLECCDFRTKNCAGSLRRCALRRLGNKAEQGESSTHRYEARGLIRRLPPDHKTIEVQHEDIPGFMPSMMMPFEVRDEKEIAGLKLGDAISFRLNVTQRDSWIDRIQKIDAGQLHCCLCSDDCANVRR